MIKLEDLHKYIGEKVYVIEPFLEFENGGIDYTLFKPKEATIEEIQMVKNIVGVLNVEITLKYPSGIIGTTNEYGVSATYEEAEEECVKTLFDEQHGQGKRVGKVDGNGLFPDGLGQVESRRKVVPRPGDQNGAQVVPPLQADEAAAKLFQEREGKRVAPTRAVEENVRLLARFAVKERLIGRKRFREEEGGPKHCGIFHAACLGKNRSSPEKGNVPHNFKKFRKNRNISLLFL